MVSSNDDEEDGTRDDTPPLIDAPSSLPHTPLNSTLTIMPTNPYPVASGHHSISSPINSPSFGHTSTIIYPFEDEDIFDTELEDGDDDMPPLVDTPILPQRKPKHNRDANHIPRPPNAFILFRSFFIHTRKMSGELSSELNNSELSKIVGKEWRALPQYEKQEWEAKAARVQEQHREKYPDWRFRPGYVASKKKTRPKAKKRLKKGKQKEDADEAAEDKSRASSNAAGVSTRKRRRSANGSDEEDAQGRQVRRTIAMSRMESSRSVLEPDGASAGPSNLIPDYVTTPDHDSVALSSPSVYPTTPSNHWFNDSDSYGTPDAFPYAASPHDLYSPFSSASLPSPSVTLPRPIVHSPHTPTWDEVERQRRRDVEENEGAPDLWSYEDGRWPQQTVGTEVCLSAWQYDYSVLTVWGALTKHTPSPSPTSYRTPRPFLDPDFAMPESPTSRSIPSSSFSSLSGWAGDEAEGNSARDNTAWTSESDCIQPASLSGGLGSPTTQDEGPLSGRQRNAYE